MCYFLCKFFILKKTQFLFLLMQCKDLILRKTQFPFLLMQCEVLNLKKTSSHFCWCNVKIWFLKKTLFWSVTMNIYFINFILLFFHVTRLIGCNLIFTNGRTLLILVSIWTFQRKFLLLVEVLSGRFVSVALVVKPSTVWPMCFCFKWILDIPSTLVYKLIIIICMNWDLLVIRHALKVCLGLEFNLDQPEEVIFLCSEVILLSRWYSLVRNFKAKE